MRAIVIPANSAEPVREVELADNLGDRLTELNRLVGGWIESVVCRDYEGTIAWVNDEGRVHGLPPNARATAHFYPFPSDYLAGDVVLLGCNRVGEDQPLAADLTVATFQNTPERRTA